MQCERKHPQQDGQPALTSGVVEDRHSASDACWASLRHARRVSQSGVSSRPQADGRRGIVDILPVEHPHRLEHVRHDA